MSIMPNQAIRRPQINRRFSNGAVVMQPRRLNALRGRRWMLVLHGLYGLLQLASRYH